MVSEGSVFSLLPEPVVKALAGLGFSQPTEPQTKAIPPILDGKNVLLIAPTGSGKTEAVLLPIFTRLVQTPERKGISILYITPLRALNRDMIKRLSYWAESLGFSVEVRHGDTEAKVRRRQAQEPPDMLVTTPETLQAILPGRLMRQNLKQVRFVVIDEVHDLAESKRGIQLSVGLERLLKVVDIPFQRIGLSATVGNPKEVARLFGGEHPMKIVVVPMFKGYRYRIEYPKVKEADYDLAEDLKTAPEAAARIGRIVELVNSNTSTLIFVNSRTNAEMLGHRFNMLKSKIAVHHGSLSREERAFIEDEFKANKLKALVCTSTLELGIDIGQVDLVIQYLSPRQVGSLIQRVGRSGHRLDLTSKGVVITAYTDDLLEAVAAANLAYKSQLEPVSIHIGALDILTHQIAGILIDSDEATVEEALNLVRRAYPYRDLPKVKFLDVVHFMHTLNLLRMEGTLLRRTRWTRRYYYENLSTIPDERRYPIIDIISDRKIGTLGDEFMALRARIGLNFICKGRVWRIVGIEDETGEVFVVPSEDPMAAVPGWDGEMIPVSQNLAREVGRLRGEMAKRLKEKMSPEEVAKDLAKELSIEKSQFLESVNEIQEQLKMGAPVPTDKLILVEGFDKYMIIHSCFGEVVNKTLGSIFDAILSDHELITGWWNDGYRILIEMPRKIRSQDLEREVELLFQLSDDEVDKAFTEYLQARFPFAYRMKFVAERFGALPRGRTMGGRRLAQLPVHFKGTPVYEETLREAMQEKVDLHSAKQIMASTRDGSLRIETTFRVDQPTPIAHHILSAYSDIPELMAPTRVILSNIERMKRSIRSRKIKLLCLSCADWMTETRLRDLQERPKCDSCGSGLLTVLRKGDDAENLKGLARRRLKREKLTEDEVKELTYARRVADLVLSYGKLATAALQVRGVGPETASRILGKMHVEDDELYMDLLKAKIQFLRTRQYWDESRTRSQ